MHWHQSSLHPERVTRVSQLEATQHQKPPGDGHSTPKNMGYSSNSLGMGYESTCFGYGGGWRKKNETELYLKNCSHNQVSNGAETARLGYVTNFQQVPTQISLFLPMCYPKFHQNEWITSSKKYDNPCLASNNRYSPKIQNKKSTKKRLCGFNVGFHSLLTSIYIPFFKWPVSKVPVSLQCSSISTQPWPLWIDRVHRPPRSAFRYRMLEP